MTKEQLKHLFPPLMEIHKIEGGYEFRDPAVMDKIKTRNLVNLWRLMEVGRLKRYLGGTSLDQEINQEILRRFRAKAS